MSELRKQLDQMRDNYRAERYPGDLASDVLSPRRKWPVGWVIGAATFLAAAAAALMWMAFAPMPSYTPNSEVAVVAPANPFDVMSAMPGDLSLIPQAQSVSELGGIPEMPSVDLNFSLQAESSEEMS